MSAIVRVPLIALVVSLGASGGCLQVPTDIEKPQQEQLATAPTTVQEVLQRHIQALGGREALQRLKHRTVEARMVFRPDRDCDEGDENCLLEEQRGAFVLVTTADGHMYRRTVIGDLVEERGFDGERGWQMLGDGTLQLEDPVETAISREDARLHWYFDLDEANIEASVLPARSHDSLGEPRILDGIKWKIAGTKAPAKTLWFDRETGLLHEEIIEDGEGENLNRQVIVYQSYRRVDDVLVPERIRLETTAGSRTQVVEFFTRQVDHEPVSAQAFEVPDKPPPKKKPDARRVTLADARSRAEAEPDDPAAAIAHARAAWAAGEFDQAASAAKQTLSLDPKEPEALWILARIQILRGNYRAAERLLGKAENAGVRKDQLAQQRAWIHSHRGDYRKLADTLDEADRAVMAGRYRSFAGEPLRLKAPSCVTTLNMVAKTPIPLVELTIGDQKVIAMIDTGATDLILDDALAQSMGVPIQTRSNMGPQGPEVGHGQLTQLGLGEFTVKAVPIDVLPREALSSMTNQQSQEVRGILGMRTLEPFQVTFDMAEGQLELVPRGKRCRAELQQRRTEQSTPFWMHETHFMYVQATMNGAPGLYLLNTGMRGVAVTANRPAYGHAGIAAPPVEPGKPAMVPVAEIQLLDGIGLKDVMGAYGFFEQTETRDGFGIDGMVGLQLLGERRWTIDFDQHRIYFADG